MKRALKGLIIAALVFFSAAAALEFRWEAGDRERAPAGFLAGPALGGRAGELAEAYSIVPEREEAKEEKGFRIIREILFFFLFLFYSFGLQIPSYY